MRTTVNLSPEQIRALDQYGKKHGVSRAEAVRKAVTAFLSADSSNDRVAQHPAFGSMKSKVDSVAFVRKLRNEWR